MTRSTLKAATSEVGPDATEKSESNLPGLLAFNTVAAGVRVGDLLRERLEIAEAAIARHAAQSEESILSGDAAERAHSEEAARLQRENRRLQLAIERANTRLAELAKAERRAEAEEASRKASQLALQIEEKISGYVLAAKQIHELTEQMDALTKEFERERRIAKEAGVPCEAQLPHESRFRPERTEVRTILVPPVRIGVFDLNGNPVGGNRRFSAISEPTEAPTTRVERVVVAQRHAPPNILDARIALPHPDGGYVVDRNRD